MPAVVLGPRHIAMNKGAQNADARPVTKTGNKSKMQVMLVVTGAMAKTKQGFVTSDCSKSQTLTWKGWEHCAETVSEKKEFCLGSNMDLLFPHLLEGNSFPSAACGSILQRAPPAKNQCLCRVEWSKEQLRM